MNTKKLQKRRDIVSICKHLRMQGKKIGFTSGVFDIIHAGHVDYLQKASGICDVLVVGVNSDGSVKKFKGKSRPIISEKQRVKVIAEMESVNYVFIFSEPKNNKNIKLLKPHFYIKAGDYTLQQLSSSNLVEEFGGKTKIIPIKERMSTTRIIDTIRQMDDNTSFPIEEDNTVYYRIRDSQLTKAVFLDRDGTINKDIQYLHEPDKFEFTLHAIKGIQKIYQAGYKIVVISNQPGIGLGYFTKEDFFRVNKRMLKGLSESGILIDKIYFCPHSKSKKCECRKPGQKLINKAVEDLNIDLSESWFVGDRKSDIEAGRRAGMSTIMVRTGAGGVEQGFQVEPNFYADNLNDAAEIILSSKRE